MKIDIRAHDITMPQELDHKTYQPTNVCEGCGNVCEWGEPHTLMDCLKEIRAAIEALQGKSPR